MFRRLFIIRQFADIRTANNRRGFMKSGFSARSVLMSVLLEGQRVLSLTFKTMQLLALGHANEAAPLFSQAVDEIL